MTDDEQVQRYNAALHAMQSGVREKMNRASNGVSKECEPKHLRVGINSAMSDHSALAKLLIDKGVITKSEYLKAIADGMEAEKAIYEKALGVVLA